MFSVGVTVTLLAFEPMTVRSGPKVYIPKYLTIGQSLARSSATQINGASVMLYAFL